jgi:hypothetical protein
MLKHSQYISSKHVKGMSSGKRKACKLQETKWMGLECANAKETRIIFGMIPIGGAIVRPRWWRLKPTEGNGYASPRRAPPMKGPRRSNLVYSTMAFHPRRTSLTRGRSSRSRRSPCPYKLLGSTPHHVGGSQVTPNQSRRHHSPKGNRRCVVDELLALVLQMIVSQTLK